MRTERRTRFIAWLICFSLIVSLSAGIMVADNAQAQTLSSGKPKGSSDLNKKAHSLTNSDFVKVIVQLRAPMSSTLNSLLNSNGVHVRKSFNNLGAHLVEMPAALFDTVAGFDEVAFVSYDRPTQSMGHLSATTGADAVRSNSGANTTGLDGSGIGIAVLDSGIYKDHTDFLDKGNNVRIVYSQDFTGENRTDDPYGHGTHVAAIAAGGGRVSNSSYLGIAPSANLINLRVLNSQGSGMISGTLAALDWVLTNKATYNIRVVNMSLGTPAIDSYKNDPVCRAVRRLVNAGVVVVVAAGNNGKNAAGQKAYGMIHSPGNEPSALTIGAVNTFGTDARDDDGVATYSSRGPTRSFWTDSLGLKHYDHLMKPDLVAPGNKILEAKSVNNLLATQNSQLNANISPVAVRDQMYLSGTSMAAPVVAGAAALLLQANPNLTPNMVKAILMYTAQPLSGFNMFEQGAGELNIEGAVRLARLFRTDLGTTKPVGAPLLTTSVLPTPQSTIGGTTFTWSQGILLGRHWAKGTSLITRYQPDYALGTIISDGTTIGNGVLISDGVVISDGVLISDGVVVSDGVIVGDGAIISDNIILSSGFTISDGVTFMNFGTVVSDGVLISDGTIISDGVLISDGTLVADGTVISDVYVQAQSAMLNGDLVNTSNVVVDDGTDCLDY